MILLPSIISPEMLYTYYDNKDNNNDDNVCLIALAAFGQLANQTKKSRSSHT